MHVHAVCAGTYTQQHQQQGEDVPAILELPVDKKAFAIMPMGMLRSMLILNVIGTQKLMIQISAHGLLLLDQPVV